MENQNISCGVKYSDLDDNNIDELAKIFDLLQKFDVQDKKVEAEKEDKLKD